MRSLTEEHVAHWRRDGFLAPFLLPHPAAIAAHEYAAGTYPSSYAGEEARRAGCIGGSG